MFQALISFMKPKKTKKPLYHFNEEFRNGYRNSWINNIKDYTP